MLELGVRFFFYPGSPLILNYRVNEIVILKGSFPYKSLFESVSFLCWPFWHAHSVQKTAKLIKESLYWPGKYYSPNSEYANMYANTQTIKIYVRLQNGFDPIVSGVHGDTKIHPRRKVSFYWVNGFVKLTLLRYLKPFYPDLGETFPCLVCHWRKHSLVCWFKARTDVVSSSTAAY